MPLASYYHEQISTHSFQLQKLQRKILLIALFRLLVFYCRSNCPVRLLSVWRGCKSASRNSSSTGVRITGKMELSIE